MNDNLGKSVFESYNDLKKSHENERMQFRLDNEDEAYRQGYFYDLENDRYEKYKPLKVCEVLLVSIGVNEINAVQRYERISDDNYELARVAIKDCDKGKSLEVFNKIADHSSDFFNTLSFTFGTDKVKMLHDASEEAITRFVQPEEIAHLCFKTLSKDDTYNEMLGSFEFDIPYYHVIMTFFEVEKAVLNKLTEDMISEGHFYTLEKTWHEKKWSKRPED